MPRYAHVAFPLYVDQLFTYTLPPQWQTTLHPGWRVLAPFGRRKITGLIVRTDDHCNIANPKPIAEPLDAFAVIPPDLMQLAAWMSDYYMTPIGQVLAAMMPPGTDRETVTMIRLVQDIGEFEIQQIQKKKPLLARILRALFVYRDQPLKKLQKRAGSKNLHKHLEELEHKKIIQIEQVLDDPDVQALSTKFVTLAEAFADEPERLASVLESLPKKSARQRAVLELLAAHHSQFDGREEPLLTQQEVLSQTRAQLSAIKTLAEKGYLRIVEKEKIRFPVRWSDEPEPAITLTPEQRHAVNEIDRSLEKQAYHGFLLHGVTGSGKTQVYVEAIDRALQKGRTAIVLVPEIALTPQMVRRFRSRFGDRVAVWHSGMSLGEKFDTWRHIHSEKFSIVIGARSAVFSPLKNLGLIVVDEEHESTYKQGETPRYHARDVAVMRAVHHGAVAVLGSATPSVESFWNSENGKLTKLVLHRRIHDVPLPPVRLVDMRREKEAHTEEWEPVFSRDLSRAIADTLAANHQCILYLNRRGFSHYVHCDACGFLAECPHCSITLTLHLRESRLRCHYCGYATPLPRVCPECFNTQIVHQGLGTQKVESHVRQRFPKARVQRMDLDTTGRKGSHHDILDAFHRGDIDILVGTQMVAKGLDFENVTLVGVISADTGLLMPDFRSGERTFQLLTQVAGRAGRKQKRGQVIIQTHHPERPSIQFAREHDYEGFYREEIGFRQELLYPPFGRLFLIRFLSKKQERAIDVAKAFSARLGEPPLKTIQILGPSAAPIEKIRDEYRWQTLIKVPRGENGAIVRRWLDAGRQHFRTMRDVTVGIEIDPYHLL